MKTLIALLLISSSTSFAIDMGAVHAAGGKIKEKGQEVFKACQKEQIEFCKGISDVNAVKECLTKNKEKLSAECKAAVGVH